MSKPEGILEFRAFTIDLDKNARSYCRLRTSVLSTCLSPSDLLCYIYDDLYGIITCQTGGSPKVYYKADYAWGALYGPVTDFTGECPEIYRKDVRPIPLSRLGKGEAT